MVELRWDVITRNLCCYCLKSYNGFVIREKNGYIASYTQGMDVHSTDVGSQSCKWTPGREDTRSTSGTTITDKHIMRCTGKTVSQGIVETEWLNKGGTST